MMSTGQNILRAVIGLGSNIPDRFRWLQSALDLWRQADQVEVVAWSDICESPPVGQYLDGDFLNAVIVIDTSLDPRELLTICQDIERKCGRDRNLEKKAGSRNRTLDCDIVFYGDMTHVITGKSGDVGMPEIPHPRWSEREFVVIPLLDVIEHLTEHQRRLVQNVTKSTEFGSASCRKYGKMLD